MNISKSGLDLIKSFEGFASTMYDDVGKPAIGYGTDLLPEEVAKYKGKTITEEEATSLLLNRLTSFQERINQLVKVPLTQNQYDAICSFTYNVGTGGFAGSTLLKKLNLTQYSEAANEFPKWNKVNGQDHPGLTARRLKEKALFLS